MKLPFSGRRYYLKFGLERDPFPAKSNDEKIFLTREIIHWLDEIKETIETSQELLVVASPAGAGKSVLAKHLALIKEMNWMVSLVHGNMEMDEDTLAYEIITQLFPERKFVSSQAVSLLKKEFLEIFARNGKVPVFIIDDAHTLPAETLKFILELAGLRRQGAKYRFVFFSDLSINERFEDPKLRDLIPDRFHNFRIPSLSREQTAKYLDYRLSLYGQCNVNPFTEDDIQRIFTESAGLPGCIHAPAKRLMQDLDIPGRAKQAISRIVINSSATLAVLVVVYSVATYEPEQKKPAKTSIAIPLKLPDPKTVAEQTPDKRITTATVTTSQKANKEKKSIKAVQVKRNKTTAGSRDEKKPDIKVVKINSTIQFGNLEKFSLKVSDTLKPTGSN